MYTDEELYNLISDRISISEIAFSVLYDRHSQKVWAYCSRLLGDEVAAKDVLQETFIRFYKGIDRSRAMSNLPAHLLKIARTICLNHANAKIEFVPYEDGEYPDTSKDDNRELLELIKIAIKKLPEDYREALILREYDCMSYLEIAEITGESLSNVKVRIHRAKAKVRELLAEHIKELNEIDAD